MRSLLPVSALTLFGAVFLAGTAICQSPAKAVLSAAEAAWNNQNWEGAAANYQKVVAKSPKNGQAWHRLGYSLHAQGKLDKALAAHVKTSELGQFAAIGCYNAACVHALKGHTDKAFAWLDKAAAKGMDNPGQFADDADMDSLRDDPRFLKIVAKIEANAANPRPQVFVQTTQRSRNRAAWFGRNGSPGQITIEHAALPWQEKFDKAVGSKTWTNKKWRLGANFWTSLDSSVPMTVAGVDVPAGYYYLTLEQRDGGKVVLALHDAAAVKKRRLDASQAARLSAGIEIPMQLARSKQMADELAIEISITNDKRDGGTLSISFGHHVITAEVTVDLSH